MATTDVERGVFSSPSKQNLEIGSPSLEVSPPSVSSDDSRKPNVFSMIMEGLGLKTEDSDDISELPEILRNEEEESLVMAADLLFSNPYKTTVDKYDELKHLTNTMPASDDQCDSSQRKIDVMATPPLKVGTPGLPEIDVTDDPSVDIGDRENATTLQYAMNTTFTGFIGHNFKFQHFFADDNMSGQYDIDLGEVYIQLKNECALYDKNAKVKKVVPIRPTREPTSSTSTKRRVPRLFGSGYVDGIRDFLQMDIQIIGDANNVGSAVGTKLNKAALFLRRYSIWLAFYTDSYPIRAIITPEKVRLFIPSSTSGEPNASGEIADEKFLREIVSPMEQLIAEWKRNNTSNSSFRNMKISFEQDVFRGLMTLIGSKQRSEFTFLKNKLHVYLSHLKILKEKNSHSIMSMTLEFHSQNLKSELTKMTSMLRSNLGAVNAILESDNAEEYITLMHISQFRNRPGLYEMDHDARSGELESALLKYGPYNPFEVYLDKYRGDLESLIDKLEMLSELVQHEESLFRLQLNYSQNEILILNTGLTILSCAIGLGAFLTGAFGMNLDNTVTLQEKKYSFPIVMFCSVLAMVLSFLVTFGYYQGKGVLPRIVGTEKPQKAGILNHIRNR